MKKNKPWLKYYKDVKTTINYPNCTMYELIKKTADKYPTSIAYSYYGKSVNYKQFMKEIETACNAFLRLGVNYGSIVSIISPNTPEAITCFYALNKIGAICNMIHPLSSEEEIKNSLISTKSEYLVCVDMAFGKVKNYLEQTEIKRTVILSISESMDLKMKIGFYLLKGRKIAKPVGNGVVEYNKFIFRAKYNTSKIKKKASGSTAAAILHSGGTTGKSKGVVLTNTNFNSLVLSELEINKELFKDISILAIMPIFHGFGLGCTFHACFTAGGHAIILPSVDPKKFDDTLLKYKPNIIACVPSILESITTSRKLAKEDLTFLKCVVCGGDTLSSESNKRIDEFLYEHGSNAKVRTAYGMTECTAGVTMMPKEVQKANSIGIPCPDFDIKIKDPKTKIELKYMEIGEICVNGPSVMMGYLDNKEETQKVLHTDKKGRVWLHTGDLGYMDEDGFVYFKARLKRMIVSSGYNIFPSQIEDVLNSHPFVENSVVVGVPHPYKGEVAKAYIVLKNGIELNSEVKKEIKAHVEKNVSKYALPYSYGYRKELPKTLIGKVAYRDLINDVSEDDEQ